MKHRFWIIVLLSLLTIPAFAQDEAPVCDAPYVTEADVVDSILSVGDAQFTDEIFTNRIRFEHAYNAIKYEVRVAQINEQASAFNMDAAQIMSLDEQIQQINVENDIPAQLANRVLGELANDAVSWQYAEANNISISSEDLSATIAAFFNFTGESSDEREVIIDDFNQRLLATGARSPEILTFFCRNAVYEAVQGQVIGDVQTTLYADVDHILVSSEEVAQDITVMIISGEDFATLAQQLSLDTGSAQRGGNIGDFPVALYVPEFADAVTTGEAGTILAPVETQFGWHIIRINSKEERPVEGDEREQIIDVQFRRWQQEQLTNVSININPDWQSFIPEL